jgi:peptidoglycan/LPS O-acetylase OafA/YrhL
LTLKQPEHEKAHFLQLDALRGVAACIVVLSHWRITWLDSPHSPLLERLLRTPPLDFVFEGSRAVITFFLLSGFVLSLSQLNGRRVDYPSYLVKRICRIYLPYLAALFLAVAAKSRFYTLNGHGSWFHLGWASPPDAYSLIQHILFIGNYDALRYNGVFWSLIQEMRISLFFPFLCALILRIRAFGGILLALCLVVLAPLSAHLHLPDTYCKTIEYTPIFIFGILIAMYRVPLTTWLNQRSTSIYWLLFTICALVFFMLTAKIGCLGILLFALAKGPVSRSLHQKLPLFLGRISYSLYLLHVTVLYVFAYIFNNRVAPVIWFIPYIVVSFGIAVLMYDWVEVPSINLGRRLARKLTTRARLT